jgi:hypothetical protein
VRLLDRIRRIWSSPWKPDHPLDAEERQEDRWFSADDERARVLDDYAGGDFDPDDDEPASTR